MNVKYINVPTIMVEMITPNRRKYHDRNTLLAQIMQADVNRSGKEQEVQHRAHEHFREINAGNNVCESAKHIRIRFTYDYQANRHDHREEHDADC
jgi:hypothetical protein